MSYKERGIQRVRLHRHRGQYTVTTAIRRKKIWIRSLQIMLEYSLYSLQHLKEIVSQGELNSEYHDESILEGECFGTSKLHKKAIKVWEKFTNLFGSDSDEELQDHEFKKI